MINNIKTAVLLGGLGGILILIGGLLGGQTGLVIGLGIGLLVVGVSYWKSDVIAIKAARARPVTEQEMPQYYAVVRELTQKAGMPMPKLYVSPEQQPNAFATGRNPEHAAVAVTEGILGVLTWDELRGVLAHEISHVGNRDILITSVAAAIAMGITFIATWLRFAAIFGGGGRDNDSNPLALLAMAILAPIAAGLLQMALSRSREYEADRSGAKLIGDGEPLAQALNKIEHYAQQIPMEIDQPHASAFIINPLTGRKMQFSNLFRTHPPTEDRIRRLQSREWAS
jgi:heat shock protein HtpX